MRTTGERSKPLWGTQQRHLSPLRRSRWLFKAYSFSAWKPNSEWRMQRTWVEILISILGLVLLVSDGCMTYQIKYKDCTQPKQVIPYQSEKMCERNGRQEEKMETYTIVQKKAHTQLTGYSCQVIKSTFTLYCGAYSHTKIAKALSSLLLDYWDQRAGSCILSLLSRVELVQD